MKKLMLFFLLPAIGFSCQNESGQQAPSSKISSKADRKALFDYLYETTLKTESFSPVKEKKLGVDVKAEMLKCKEDFINASTEEELFFAIKKFSCARKDRHLDVSLVEGGLSLPEIPEGRAPIAFLPDFSEEGQYFMFVSDVGKNVADYIDEQDLPEVGDKLLKVNGLSFESYFKQVEPYLRYSDINNLWRRFAYSLPTRSQTYLPHRFFKENFEITLEKEDGSVYDLKLPYLAELDFQGLTKPQYPGYQKVFETTCYHLYRPEDPDDKTLLLWWYGFRSSIEEDMDTLMTYAEENNLLEHDVILDMTTSRGGSRGAVMLTRLQPKPYKTTFGNVRLSEIGMEFVKNRLEEPYKKKLAVLDGAAVEGDNSQWVLDWIAQDVYPRKEAGEDYSSNVPFKCAHAPHTSDGILEPAEQHFRGKMVCLMGPWGGSHLDQFASIVSDNDLAHTIGMPTGGYSNTWEAEKVIEFPISGQPVLEFMWSIGHTISPNGEIVEGNAAPVDEYVPLSRENASNYMDVLLKKAKAYLNTT